MAKCALVSLISLAYCMLHVPVHTPHMCRNHMCTSRDREKTFLSPLLQVLLIRGLWTIIVAIHTSSECKCAAWRLSRGMDQGVWDLTDGGGDVGMGSQVSGINNGAEELRARSQTVAARIRAISFSSVSSRLCIFLSVIAFGWRSPDHPASRGTYALMIALAALSLCLSLHSLDLRNKKRSRSSFAVRVNPNL